MTEYAEISIDSLKSIKREMDQSISLLKEFKGHVKPKRLKKIKQIDDLVESLHYSQEIVQDCLKQPIHEGYHT